MSADRIITTNVRNCPRCGQPSTAETVECSGCGALLIDLFGVSAEAQRTPSPSEWSEPLGGSLRTGVIPSLTPLGDRYQILDLLGEGGMGRVYKARDLELDRIVALKTIRGERAREPEALQRFKQELLLASKITHKNVVRIYDMGEGGGVKFFTMELVEGRSLKELIHERGRISASDTVAMARQILSALDEAHREGVIHRDLKPQNIVVTDDGVPKIMDFGIARSEDAASMTDTGSVLGTPDYMAPEQLTGRKSDGQSDLYSFGIVLYEMLTGEVPFQADTAVGKAMMRLTVKPRAVREIAAEVPPYLENVVRKCMEVDRALRYKSAQEVLDDIEREQVDKSRTLKARRAVARRSKPIAAAALVAILSTGGYGVKRWLAARAAAETEPPVISVAILPFTNETGASAHDWMRTGLPGMLITDLSQSRFVRPLPEERVFKVLEELNLHETADFDGASLKTISERLQVHSVIHGRFTALGSSLRLDVFLRRTGSGVTTPIKVETDVAEALSAVDQTTRNIKEHLDLTEDQLKGDTDNPVAHVSTASVEALRAYQAGLLELRKGSNQAAAQLFEKAAAADPQFVMAHAKQGEALLNAGEGKAAQAPVERARALAEQGSLVPAERYHVHAIAARARNDNKTAAESYAELAKLYPNDPDVQLSLATALQRQGDNPRAKEAFQKVLELAPNDGAALLGLARTEFDTGNSGEAIRLLQTVLASNQFKSDPEVMGLIHSGLGVAHKDTGQLDKAIEHLSLSLNFRRQARNRRGEAVTLSNMAHVYTQRGELAQALNSANQAVSIARQIGDPGAESTALLQVGQAYKNSGKFDQALGAFRESRRIEDKRKDVMNLAVPLNHIADIYLIRGQYEDALGYLERARRNLERSEYRQEMGFTLRGIALVKKAGAQYDEALESLLEALTRFEQTRQKTGIVSIQLELARIYASQGRYRDAEKALEKSLEINREINAGRDLAESLALSGSLLATLGRLEEAETALTEARTWCTKVNALDWEALILLGEGELQRLQGSIEKAAATFEKARVLATRYNLKEIALKSKIEWARTQRQLGRLASAERMLQEVSGEASRIQHVPIAAEAAAALAELSLARRDWRKASETAREAIALAERFSGRPILLTAYGTLADASSHLKQNDAAVAAYTKVTDELESIGRDLGSDDAVAHYVARTDVKALLISAMGALPSSTRAQHVRVFRKHVTQFN